MKEKISCGFLSMFLFLLFPYLLTIFINGVDTALLNRGINVENLLPGIVSMQISPEYEKETIKAQTVIARSNLYRKIKETDDLSEIFAMIRESAGEPGKIWVLPESVYEEAAEETRGQVLSFEGELKLVPYHEISGGMTRNGIEVFQDEEYSYLKAVDSSIDRKSPDFLNSTYFLQQQLPAKLEIVERDSSGYVKSLLSDQNILEGEAFRQGMGLSSSDFTIQKVGDRYRFLCKGKGHGIGFSQYGGNVLAKNGKNYAEILNYYFPAMILDNVNDVSKYFFF